MFVGLLTSYTTKRDRISSRLISRCSVSTSPRIMSSLLLSSSRFSSLVLREHRSGMYTDTIRSLLCLMCATTAVISAESAASCVTASSLDAQMHDRIGARNDRLPCAMNLVHRGFVPGSTTCSSARKQLGSWPRIKWKSSSALSLCSACCASLHFFIFAWRIRSSLFMTLTGKNPDLLFPVLWALSVRRPMRALAVHAS
jgi:hypothetical protein